MDFPISGQHLEPAVLAGLGFVIGVLGGFFGVGGSFLAGPSLLLLGVPANFTVGTDLAHIVGKSVVGARRHWILGNVDLKLGGLMVAATIVGSEIGAQLIQRLKRLGQVEGVVAISYIAVLLAISVFMTWEGIATIRMQRQRSDDPDFTDQKDVKTDANAFGGLARWVQGVQLTPMVKLPTSRVEVSLWAILVVGLIGGVFSGFLGGGAGYIRMPALVYLLGVPTHVAVGTDLFEVMISASYGTVTHALKGNVDILIALVMNTGAAIGAQIGAIGTQYFRGPKIRLAFVPLPLLGAALVAWHRFH